VLNAAGGWNRVETFAGERHIATYSGGPAGTTYFIHADWLGTERARTTVAATTYETCTSLPFGDNLQCSNADVSPLHFTGKERDAESGLDNFRVRYDSSNFGRFLSPDPNNAGGFEHQDDPQSWNGYSYARNNPLIYRDPNGESYTICDTTNHYQSITDVGFGDYLQRNPNVELINNQIYIKDDNGNFQLEGSYKAGPSDDSIGPEGNDILGGALIGLASGGAVAAGEGLIDGLAGSAGREAVKGAATSAAGTAVDEAAEISTLAAKAATTVGNQSAVASSRDVALKAAQEFLGPGATPIRAARGAGDIIGEISADGQRVMRYTSIDKASPYINLENKLTGGNLHIRF